MPILEYRKERDSLGEVRVPRDASYGVQTQRAVENFPVSRRSTRPGMIRAYAHIKKAAAQANQQLNLLDDEKAKAIIRVCDELLAGDLADQFVVDAFQAEAGTSFHMNVNEVIANRGLEMMGHQCGQYEHLHPNDHVNCAQSTNDTFPTAIHLAVIHEQEKLDQVLKDLSSAIREKGDAFSEVIKSARTHLQDAVPITLGQEFSAYAAAIEHCRSLLARAAEDLHELPIGGTAAGTGLNAHREYQHRVVEFLANQTQRPLRPARDLCFSMQSRVGLGHYSGCLRDLATELSRIANDLRLMDSGPTTGFKEIRLPAVQPGSSIMPGKVNPVLPGCLNMICFHVIGADTAVNLAVGAGQFDLNVMMPLMAEEILGSHEILVNFLPIFTQRCIAGIEADVENCRRHFERSVGLGTVLNPIIGYDKAAKLVQRAVRENRSIPELAVEMNLMTPAQAKQAFDPSQLTRSAS